MGEPIKWGQGSTRFPVCVMCKRNGRVNYDFLIVGLQGVPMVQLIQEQINPSLF
jgi:hypothetical protein